MADEVRVRDAKLIQYLNEAYGKEKQLEQALQVHIKMTDVAPYKKRLQEHLKETKNHAKQLERRVKQLGGKAEVINLPGPDAVAEATTTVATMAGKAVAAAQGAVHAVRGTSKQEQLLKNAKDEYHEEAEEIANYTAIQTFAEAVLDSETAKLAKGILREEERMASFLEKQIPRLAKAVATAEVPAAERRKPTASRRSSTTRRATASSRKPATASASRGNSGSSRSGSTRTTSRRTSSNGGARSTRGASASRSRARSSK